MPSWWQDDIVYDGFMLYIAQLLTDVCMYGYVYLYECCIAAAPQSPHNTSCTDQTYLIINIFALSLKGIPGG